jgi:plasmid stabilization system protein ParE
MQRFTVVITEPAQEDIARSYEWGVKEWGTKQAQRWIRELRTAITGLKHLPERHQLAPESDAFDIDIRQLIVGRYRVLNTIAGKRVSVLHVRGAYSE